MAAGPNTQIAEAQKHALTLFLEDGAGFAQEPTGWANRQKLEMLDPGFDSLKKEGLPNEGINIRGGDFEEGEGLAHTTARFPHKTYINGVGDVSGSPGAGDGEVQTRANGFGMALAACLGAEPVLITGDTIAASPTPSVSAVQVTTAASFPSGLQILHIVRPDGTVVARPATHNGSGLMTFLMELAAADVPAAGAVVLGGTLLKETESHTESLYFHLLGENTAQHGGGGGCVGKFTIEESAAAASQKVAFEWMIAKLLEDFAGTRLPPPNNRPKPGAYSQILFAKLGTADTLIDTCFHRLSVAYQPEYFANECNSNAEELGMDGWTKKKSPGKLKIGIKVRDSLDITTGGFTGPAVMDVYSNGGSDNSLHLFYQIGNKPGAILSGYLPIGRITERPSKNQNVDGASAIGLMIGPSEEADTTSYPNLFLMQQA